MSAPPLLALGRADAQRLGRNVRLLGLGPDAEFFAVYSLACLVAKAGPGVRVAALSAHVARLLDGWGFPSYAAYHRASPEAAADKALRGRAALRAGGRA